MIRVADLLVNFPFFGGRSAIEGNNFCLDSSQAYCTYIEQDVFIAACFLIQQGNKTIAPGEIADVLNLRKVRQIVSAIENLSTARYHLKTKDRQYEPFSLISVEKQGYTSNLRYKIELAQVLQDQITHGTQETSYLQVDLAEYLRLPARLTRRTWLWLENKKRVTGNTESLEISFDSLFAYLPIRNKEKYGAKRTLTQTLDQLAQRKYLQYQIAGNTVSMQFSPKSAEITPTQEASISPIAAQKRSGIVVISENPLQVRPEKKMGIGEARKADSRDAQIRQLQQENQALRNEVAEIKNLLLLLDLDHKKDKESKQQEIVPQPIAKEDDSVFKTHLEREWLALAESMKSRSNSTSLGNIPLVTESVSDNSVIARDSAIADPVLELQDDGEIFPAAASHVSARSRTTIPPRAKQQQKIDSNSTATAFAKAAEDAKKRLGYVKKDNVKVRPVLMPTVQEFPIEPTRFDMGAALVDAIVETVPQVKEKTYAEKMDEFIASIPKTKGWEILRWVKEQYPSVAEHLEENGAIIAAHPAGRDHIAKHWATFMLWWTEKSRKEKPCAALVTDVLKQLPNYRGAPLFSPTEEKLEKLIFERTEAKRKQQAEEMRIAREERETLERTEEEASKEKYKQQQNELVQAWEREKDTLNLSAILANAQEKAKNHDMFKGSENLRPNRVRQLQSMREKIVRDCFMDEISSKLGFSGVFLDIEKTREILAYAHTREQKPLTDGEVIKIQADILNNLPKIVNNLPKKVSEIWDNCGEDATRFAILVCETYGLNGQSQHVADYEFCEELAYRLVYSRAD